MAPAQDTNPSLYESTTQRRLQDYEHTLNNETYRPFTYPWDSLPALWLLLALFIFPRLPGHVVHYLRIPTLLLILGHCIYVGRSCRTIGFAGGYGIGLAAMWGCIMTVTLLLVKDLKTDFQRLEVRPSQDSSNNEQHSNGSATGMAERSKGQAGALKNRKDRNEPAAIEDNKDKETPSYRLAWSGCPSSLGHSLDWTIDLVTSFRGVNWNFRNHGLPALPSDITQQSHAFSSTATREIQLTGLRDFLVYYLLTDIVKYLVIQDPYFLGLAPLTTPSPYAILQPHPTLTRLLRLILALSSTHIVLALIFTLSPIIFPLIPQQLTGIPLRHPAMYPPLFSPLFSTISHSGLAGFWGKCWHQMFRFGISQPGLHVTKRYDLPPKGDLARAVQVVTAFFLSGCIHASASYTSFPPNGSVSKPLSGPLTFFLLQAVGVLLQSWIARMVETKSFPEMVRKVANASYVLLWLYFTGPLLADDFARAGVWLFEPVPVSFVRGLMGEGWWKWGGRWAGWSEREEWWLKGLAVY